METSGPQPAPGLAATLRALFGSVVALLRTRAELLSLEMAEARERWKDLLVLAAVTAVFLFLGLQFLGVLVVVLLWDSYRIAAAVGVTCLYLGIGLWALVALRHRWRSMPRPFAASLQELGKDLETLGRRDE